jgi:glutamate racemase
VLGCTHYPFVIPVLEKVGGTAVSIIDPAPAVARQVGRILRRNGLLAANQPARLDFFTTGSPANFARQVQRLLGDERGVKTAVWRTENRNLILQSDQLPL